jgi:hypothetical protein
MPVSGAVGQKRQKGHGIFFASNARRGNTFWCGVESFIPLLPEGFEIPLDSNMPRSPPLRIREYLTAFYGYHPQISLTMIPAAGIPKAIPAQPGKRPVSDAMRIWHFRVQFHWN